MRSTACAATVAPSAPASRRNFVVAECVCNAVDRITSIGGTYRLHNHPSAEFINAAFGYGLRLDGVLGAGSIVVFDFDANNSAVYLRYDKAAGGGRALPARPGTSEHSCAGTVRIYGTAIGGALSGDVATCNAGGCSIVNPE